MEHIRLQKRLELVWWLFTALLCFAVLLPVLLNVPGFPFYPANIIFIIIFVTFARYIFLLKHTFLARLKWVKAAIIGLSTILVFILITTLGNFNNFLQEQGLQSLVSHLPFRQQNAIKDYIHNEMIFFGVGSIIAAILMPFRMLVSIWRQRNTGKV